MLQSEKLIRLPINKFDNYKNSSSRFKTQVGFIQEVEKLKNNLQIPNSKKYLIHCSNPINNITVNYNLSLLENFNKKATHPEVARLLAIETINK